MILFIFFLLIALYFQNINSQTARRQATAKSDVYAKAVQQASRFVDLLRQKQDIPGISVCVGTKDKILWAEGFGLADVENNVAVTTASTFRIGSVSKSLTSVALGKLVEEGKLDLDAPINQYVPTFPQKKFPITTRQHIWRAFGLMGQTQHYRPENSVGFTNRMWLLSIKSNQLSEIGQKSSRN